jgi:precorrin-2 dehydrogenase / sirohydrochlorin ferrochelatase
MGWTPLFLEMKDKKVLIVGSGEVGNRRSKRFLDAEAQVVVIGNHVQEDIIELGAKIKPVTEIKKWVEWADIVVTASGDHELNQEVAEMSGKKLINRADKPNNGNLIVPSSFFIGDVQICIFTGGKSPLMSKELRKKIEKVIKPEDVLQLELQSFARNLLKETVNDHKKRKEYLYTILKTQKIQELLKEGQLEESKACVKELISNINNPG